MSKTNNLHAQRAKNSGTRCVSEKKRHARLNWGGATHGETKSVIRDGAESGSKQDEESEERGQTTEKLRRAGSDIHRQQAH